MVSYVVYGVVLLYGVLGFQVVSTPSSLLLALLFLFLFLTLPAAF
jgi:hypothetical protein